MNPGSAPAMRIKSNKLRHLREFFQTELSAFYDDREINALFTRAADHYLGLGSTELAVKMDDHLNQSDMLKLYDCAKALATGKPLQYILGESWFFGLRFKVTPAVLIPRPETEELTELVLKIFLRKRGRALDIGTGSGCLAVAIKKNRSDLEVHACDISTEALALAKQNAEAHQSPVTFFSCDILNELPPGNFDLIVSNPPYITEDERAEMARHVVDYEPWPALFAPKGQPLIFYEKITELCGMQLNSGGMVFMELNPATAEAVKTSAGLSGFFSEINLLRDMSGHTRFFYGVRK